MPPFLTTPEPSFESLHTASSESDAVISDKTQSPDPTTTHPKVVENWQGWAELENDPAIFSTLLREWGVPSVQVQEVFELDRLFDDASDAIFGLVFLSRWVAPGDDTQDQLTTTPDDLWFANQARLINREPFSLTDVRQRSRPTLVRLWRS